MFKFFSFILVLICCGYATNVKYLTEQPNYVNACKSNDTKCLAEGAQSLILKLKNGFQELQIPPTDPLKIDKIDLSQNQAESFNVSVILRNVVIRGMSDLIVKSTKYDKDSGLFTFDMVLPEFRLVSDYSVKGRIILLQLNGHGKMFMTGEKAIVKMTAPSELREEDGEEFFYIKNLKVHYKLAASKTRLENLFNGNKELANFIKACKSTDIKCLTENMQSIFIQLKTGIPGLKDVPPIDPLKIDKVEIGQDQAQALNLSVILTNAEINGLSDAIVTDVKYDEGKGAFSMDMEFPKLNLVSDYSLKGRVLLIFLNSTGKMYMSSDSVKATLNVLSEYREEDGEKFIYIKAVKINYKLTGVKAKLENLFNGNKELEDSANLLFNESWEELNQAFEPVFEKNVENVLLPVMRKVFLYIPAKFMFS